MIDIHNHTLFAVDDGAETIETALAMLEIEAAQGVTDVILTPHCRAEMFECPAERIKEHFSELLAAWKKRESENALPSLRLYLGCEYHVDSEMLKNLKNGKGRTLAGSPYVLAEYSYSTGFSYIKRTADELLSNGYEPIIAHVERYGCFERNPELLYDIRRMGCMVQLNADSVLGLEGREPKKFCKKVLKNGWADLIASDAHRIDERACHMQQCRDFVAKKYGPATVERLFRRNGERILYAGEAVG